MNPKLSILIPTSPDRHDYFLNRLNKKIFEQLAPILSSDMISSGATYSIWKDTYNDVEVIYYMDDKVLSIGQKRNILMRFANGEYLNFIDDDDLISDTYFKVILSGIDTGADAIELKGIITEDGMNPKLFIHSMKYDHWFEKDNVYYRNNNHLSPIKSYIAKQMKFPETNNGEDHDYSKQLHASGLIKTEYPVSEPYYFYEYRSKK